jgi:hypothetical protein
MPDVTSSTKPFKGASCASYVQDALLSCQLAAGDKQERCCAR